jgi:repressor LexA
MYANTHSVNRSRAAVLSPQKRRILQVIRDETAARGYSPSVREIAKLTGVRSPAGVHKHLKALERQGYLRRLSNKPSTFKVTSTDGETTSSEVPLEGHPRSESAGRRFRGEQLTARQRRIVEVMRDSIVDRGYPPSIREIGEAVGLTSSASVHSQLEALQRKGFIRRDPTKPRAIEVHFDDPVAALPRPLPTYVPLMSAPVAAGTGTLPEDVVEELVPLPRDLVGQGELFMLQVRGDSMVGADVRDRDYVVVRRHDTDNKNIDREEDIISDGDMVVALLPNQEAEATVKHFSRRAGHVWLLPANPAFEPIDGDQAQILGKVVALFRRMRPQGGDQP